MIDLKGFSKLSKEELKFIDAYHTKIGYYRYYTEYYKEFTKLKDIEEAETVIKNTHLWIAAFIDKYPDLKEFKEEVEQKMKDLGIVSWPDEVYQDNFMKSY